MTQPEWGHPLIGPKGEILRVPLWAYKKLHRLGVKKRYSIHLLPTIYELLNPKFDVLTDVRLRRLLGADLGGPDWLVCHCRECKHKESQTDNTPMPGRAHSMMIAEDLVAEVKRARRK